MKIEIKTTIDTSKIGTKAFNELLWLLDKAEIKEESIPLKVVSKHPPIQGQEGQQEQEREKQFITVTKEVPYKPEVTTEPEPERETRHIGRPIGRLSKIGRGNGGNGRKWVTGKIRIVMSYVKNHPNMTDNEIREKLNLKSKASVYHARKRLREQEQEQRQETTTMQAEKPEKKKHAVGSEFRINQSKKMKYISNRTWELVKQYNYDYEKAYRFASNEYSMKFNRPKVDLPELKTETSTENAPPKTEVLPKLFDPVIIKRPSREDVQLETITVESQDLLHSMLKNIAGIHQGRINRQITEWYLKRSNDFVWSSRAYEEFFTELLTKIKKICEYLEIKDKFKFNSETQEVIYTGG